MSDLIQLAVALVDCGLVVLFAQFRASARKWSAGKAVSAPSPRSYLVKRLGPILRMIAAPVRYVIDAARYRVDVKDRYVRRQRHRAQRERQNVIAVPLQTSAAADSRRSEIASHALEKQAA